jgi:hypothetical protein
MTLIFYLQRPFFLNRLAYLHQEIAERTTEKGYWTYFNNKRAYGIQMFQDQEILQYFKVNDQD